MKSSTPTDGNITLLFSLTHSSFFSLLPFDLKWSKSFSQTRKLSIWSFLCVCVCVYFRSSFGSIFNQVHLTPSRLLFHFIWRELYLRVSLCQYRRSFRFICATVCCPFAWWYITNLMFLCPLFGSMILANPPIECDIQSPSEASAGNLCIFISKMCFRKYFFFFFSHVYSRRRRRRHCRHQIFWYNIV